VLGNLVSNAIKFTSQGAVRVSVDVRDGADSADAVLVLDVGDTGIGFDQLSAQKLFQRFSQADGSITRRFGGTGLGLSICSALVEMMGGEIRSDSEPGRGSEFQVRLPLPRCAEEVRGAPAGAIGDVAGLDLGGASEVGPLRVLLAEDHLVNQRVVELILGPVGLSVTKVATGDEALRAYMAEEFALVLMDMQMPVMDGLAATRAIRDFERTLPARRRTPIIMLSANAMRQHSEEAIAAGADFHLAKPVTPAGLLGAVARALNTTTVEPTA
jgi:CheY-like chemotaxis protein